MLPLGGYSMLERIGTGEIPVSFGGGDGRSSERAIQIEGVRNHVEGVKAEYCWLANLEQEEGAVEIESQALMEIDSRQYDCFDVKVAGERRQYYFGIDRFWGLQPAAPEAGAEELPANDANGSDANDLAGLLSRAILGSVSSASPTKEFLPDLLSSAATDDDARNDK
jgi:hypothetical protein